MNYNQGREPVVVYSDITLDMINDYAAYKLDPAKPYTLNSFVARISADIDAIMMPQKSPDSVYNQAAGMLSKLGITMAGNEGLALPAGLPLMASGRSHS